MTSDRKVLRVADFEQRAADLRTARRTSGLTQQHLADLAELSVRTIRGMEQGSVVSPHRDSLTRIATTLGLGHAERLDFLRRWGVDDHHPLSEILDLYGGEEPGAAEIREAIRARFAAVQPLLVMARYYIGDERQCLFKDTDVALLALKADVRGTIHIIEPVAAVELDLIELTPLENCQVPRQRALSSLGVKVFDVAFGRTLQYGDTHVYRYRTDFRRATAAVADQSATSVEVFGQGGEGTHRVLPVYSVQVCFAAGRLPTQCVQIFRAHPDAATVEVGNIPLTPWSTVQLTLRDAKPGNHGLRWYW